MCLIIVATRPQKNPITHAELKRANKTNPDGFGVAALYKDGTIVTTKGFGDKDAWAAVKEAQTSGAVSVVFHARIATSGYIEKAQCHPYAMHAPSGEKRFLFHNGILQGIPMPNGDRSDTWHLAKTLSRYETTPKLLTWLDEYAQDNHSRFVLLSHGGLYIANRKSGTERDGKWYSGYSAFPFKPFVSTGYWDKKNNHWVSYGKPVPIGGPVTSPHSAFASDGSVHITGNRLSKERETDVLDVPDQALESDEEFLRWLERNDQGNKYALHSTPLCSGCGEPDCNGCEGRS